MKARAEVTAIESTDDGVKAQLQYSYGAVWRSSQNATVELPNYMAKWITVGSWLLLSVNKPRTSRARKAAAK